MPRSVKDPLVSNGANVTGTLDVAAKGCGVSAVVAASSSSVYGGIPTRLGVMVDLEFPIRSR